MPSADEAAGGAQVGATGGPPASSEWLPGVHPATNIQADPEAYEIENRAVDPEGRIEAAMRRIADWSGRDVLDLGAGTGFHIPLFAATARHVFGVEPHDPSRLLAMERCVRVGVANASVLVGSAEAIPLRDASVDVVHARFAYFWGPGAEPGIAEMARVLRPGGTAFVIDNDLRTGTFADWLTLASGTWARDPDEIEAFWREQGFSVTIVRSMWRFATRADLERVVRNEFVPEIAETILAGHRGLEVEYHYALYARTA
jgi:ubiquinone/menaquinone biosynthesis C-methylase UbiE